MGTLYICPTPIGNLDDVSQRLIDVLNNVDLIYCEDTRRAKKLLNHFGIETDIESYFIGNEVNKIEDIKSRLTQKVSGRRLSKPQQAPAPTGSSSSLIVGYSATDLIFPFSENGPANYNFSLFSKLPTNYPKNPKIFKKQSIFSDNTGVPPVFSIVF